MDDPIRTEMMKHRLVSVAEEMGARLQRAAFSPNIKERCDFSCAVFDASGNLVAQAAHIPVHLGAMPLSVQACLESLTLAPGDVAMVNDPYRGGTHLPDLTVVSPVFVEDTSPPTLLGLVANRAHHADIGGMSAGSMPLSQEIFQEGLIIPPVKLMVGHKKNDDIWRMLLANVRTPEERMGDLQAQLAANQIGGERMRAMAERFGAQPLLAEMDALLRYSERMTRQLISTVPNGCYRFEDTLDNDGFTKKPAVIRVAIMIEDDQATVDFSGTDTQRPGSINAVYPVTLSAVAYVFRCVLGLDIPANSGCLRPIQINAPEGTLVNAGRPAAVAAGNVETSQRIVDVLLGALAQACPDRIPAASQGTMNNLTIGGWDQRHNRPFAYYETIGGGMGAGPEYDGGSGRHSHMTNTLNTPVEAVEYAYPFRIARYAFREKSGGSGQHQGGDGIIRTYEFLQPAEVTLLSDRRVINPYGLEGGESGQPGRNRLKQNGEEQDVPGKCSFPVEAGDELTIETPGGGGYGINENLGQLGKRNSTIMENLT
ncbi:MAG: hydantoinase B/oxoprolinase family protein [Nitrospiraceae bacterium]|nr:hydantoinase B/oxoprolinase family protein [Nitrospira sp.]MCA9456652.1 hydantoinase B/oxoprolinase family protein [Nitrospira sp.]MCB9776548.1 hydantoinase B/oxoprolinase family protein [Nitrospiraceae bacterium]